MRYRSLNRNRDFSRVYRRGKSYVHPHMVLYVAKNRLGTPRVGLTATKKVGGAVRRNRARRVLRAALQAVLPDLSGGVDIILVARAATPHLKSWQAARTLAGLCRKAGLPHAAPPPRPAAPAVPAAQEVPPAPPLPGPAPAAPC